MGKKAFFTWSADSTPFANAFRTFLHYLISISYSCHAFVFYVYNTFTFWKSSQNLHKCTLADSWHRKPICDATSQKPAATRKCTFCNCLQPPPVPAAVTNNSLDFDLPIHKMASRGPRHASSTNCPEFGDQLNGENQLNWTMIWNGRQFQWETSWMCHVSYRTTWIPSQMKVKQHNKTISGIYLTWLALLDHHN